VATLRDIKLEKSMKLDFLDEVYALPGGDKVKDCIQCGTCSGSCPASFKMEKTPREIFSMIRAGMRDEVLASNTIWYCSSCYTCPVRCPKEIKIPDVFYALKRIAIHEGRITRKHKAAALSSCFAKMVNRYGRNSEVRLMAAYFLKADLFGWIGKIPTATKLFFKGRLPLIAHKIKGIKQLRQIVKKVESISRNGGGR
jgi:heterodisulfide reductase subunit C